MDAAADYEMIKYKGLCALCKNEIQCTFPRSRDKRISHCEEFEGLEGDLSHVREIVDRDGLIAALGTIQSKCGYLPEEEMRALAGKSNYSLIDIYGVATFYRMFSLKPRGKHLISVCLGTACHVRGGPAVAGEFKRQLGIKPGETTEDGEFTLETVNCLGACALGPIVVVDGHYFSNVNISTVGKIMEKARLGLDDAGTEDQSVFPVIVRCSHCNHSLMDTRYLIDGFPSIRLTVSFGNNHGWIRLSSLYGSYQIQSQYKIPVDTVVYCFCPHCHTELVASSNCVACQAPMVPMVVQGGGMIQICSRRGCRNHMLDLDGVNL
ncbi:MAG: NAD(P)H-dependent oxidoreductase subunit E [Candidatus Eremiobacteraeota bacterium]|nr:NAD(P)H-dependent oxidoreductase subunit E [Candidatus Eremiobacteraeota bacterium]